MLDTTTTTTPVSAYDIDWTRTTDGEYRDLCAGIATLYADLYDASMDRSVDADQVYAADTWTRLALMEATETYADRAAQSDAHPALAADDDC